MSIIEVHPEELLDREQRGQLTASERVLLSAHLARCAPCRLERQLRLDFEGELGTPSGSHDLTDAIAGALRACELPSISEPQASVAAARGSSPTARRVAMLLVACAVLSVGVGYAGAQLGLAERGFGALLEQMGVRSPAPQHVRRPRVPQVPAQAAVERPSAPKPDSWVASSPLPEVVAPVAAVRRELRAESAEGRAPVAEPRAVGGAPAKQLRIKGTGRGRAAASQQRSAGSTTLALAAGSASNRVSFTKATTSEPAPAPQALPSSPAGAGVEPAAPALPPETPARLFERANRARYRGLSGEARVLYAELRAHYPDSAEARLSQALVARLQLDQGELDAALSGFDAYLSGPDRALHEEAMVGRIRALSRLGRAREAAAAAQSLLKAHPRSAFAEEAEALVERVGRD